MKTFEENWEKNIPRMQFRNICWSSCNMTTCEYWLIETSWGIFVYCTVRRKKEAITRGQINEARWKQSAFLQQFYRRW